MSTDFSDKSINLERRQFLINATSAVSAAGVVGVATPFVRSWTPSAKAKAAGAPIRINIANLAYGQMLGPIPEWRGKPVFVVKRSLQALEALESRRDRLKDPDSKEEAQQPGHSENYHRSIESEIGVYVGLCTHLGCSPTYYGQLQPEAFDSEWKGGFFCPCHGSRFDLAGRVFRGVPAPTNLEVPPYYYQSDSVIVIGAEAEA